jgi:hypothetical protein
VHLSTSIAGKTGRLPGARLGKRLLRTVAAQPCLRLLRLLQVLLLKEPLSLLQLS